PPGPADRGSGRHRDESAKPWHPSGARLGVEQRLVKFGRRAGVAELLPEILPPDQASDAAQDLDVLPGGGFGADDQEKEPDRLVVDRVVWDRGGTHSADERQLADRGGTGMWNGHPKADSGTQYRFPFFH